MSLRKTAGLLAAFGLMVGLIGGGIGASFFDQVTGTENINVGTLACRITDATTGANIAGDQKSVSYTASQINSSAAGSAPFSFTVENTGSIDQVLTVAMTGQTGNLGGHFSAIPASPSPVALPAGASQAISTGIQWTVLVNDDLGRAGSMTWTVNCGEVPAPVTIVHTQIGIASTGWYGWSCPAGSTIVSGSVDTALVVDGPAESGSTVSGSTYPVFPHYTFTPPEEGWVVQNAGGPATQVLTIVCQPLS